MTLRLARALLILSVPLALLVGGCLSEVLNNPRAALITPVLLLPLVPLADWYLWQLRFRERSNPGETIASFKQRWMNQ